MMKQILKETGYFEIPELWGRGTENSIESVLRFYSVIESIPEKTSILLDVGTGNGLFLDAVRKLKPQIRAIGLDSSWNALKSRKIANRAVLATIQKLPFLPNSFDLVTAFEILEHLPHDSFEKSIEELMRVSRKFILISVPFQERILRVICPQCFCSFNRFFHNRRLSEHDLEILFKPAKMIYSRTIGREKMVPGWDILNHILFSLAPMRFFPHTTVCPQCGFSKKLPGINTKHYYGGVHRVRKMMKSILPGYNKPKWLLALFQKNEYPSY